MATGEENLKGFSGTLNRLERRLEDIGSRFREMDEAARGLMERLERHRLALAQQAQQDQVWASLTQDSLSPAEASLLFGYVSDTLRRCHTRVLERVPDLAAGLPTTASVLRRRPKNRRVDAAWTAVLGELGLGEADARALCAFYVTQGFKCEYKGAGRTPGQQGEAEAVIRRCVGDRTLRDSLLRAVLVVEEGKAAAIETGGSRTQKPACSLEDLIKKTEG